MDEIFEILKEKFIKNNFQIFIIGGTSRDFLLKKPINDYDFVTDAKPEEVKKILENYNDSFEKFGVIKTSINNKNIDIVTFRKEQNYSDFRHPNNVVFTNNLSDDYIRRDFTINAIYIDHNYNVIDPTSKGVDDLNNKVLRLIGNADLRIKEDPLRILRGFRFIKEYNLECEEKTRDAFLNNLSLLKNINKNKIREEVIKMGRICDEIYNK